MRYPINFELKLRKHKHPGRLIALEGNEGGGKTTQAMLLVEKLKKSGKKAVYTKEPTNNSEIGKLIRRVLSGELKVPPVSLQYLFCADRAVHQIEIENYLKRNYIVITDRYFWSAVAYGITDMDGKPDYYLAAFSILSFYHQFISPDYTFYLDVSIEEAKKRISRSEKHTEIYDKSNMLLKIDKAYKKLINKFPQEFDIVDANRTEKEVLNELFVKLKI